LDLDLLAQQVGQTFWSVDLSIGCPVSGSICGLVGGDRLESLSH